MAKTRKSNAKSARRAPVPEPAEAAPTLDDPAAEAAAAANGNAGDEWPEPKGYARAETERVVSTMLEVFEALGPRFAEAAEKLQPKRRAVLVCLPSDTGNELWVNPERLGAVSVRYDANDPEKSIATFKVDGTEVRCHPSILKAAGILR